MNVSIKAEPLFELFGVEVTNSMLLGVGGIILLIAWLVFVSRRIAKDRYGTDKKGFFTRLVLWCFEGLYRNVCETIPNQKVAKAVAPFVITIFFVVAIQYYVGILPFVGEAITVGGHTPLFRSQVADLNFTIMLAIITLVAVQVWAIKVLGFKGSMKRYFVNPLKDPINSFAGALELISEFSRTVALALRLFGNVFAGEVLLLVVAYLGSFASPLLLPFFFIFELFIGGIQAYVFFMLATVFVGLAVSHGGHTESSHSTGAKKAVSEMST
ncbi:MAG: F0F1 ATP synthase subunit A [Candidatus Nomurabacteria bacterium]|nr:F0F1 ATP synthase subunit A [Candidatus Nomurabacteria bacterium]